MLKKELIDAIAEETGLSKSLIGKVLPVVFDKIIEGAVADGKCFCGDGHKFVRKKLAARTGRNPNTGETIQIPEREVIIYRKRID